MCRRISFPGHSIVAGGDDKARTKTAGLPVVLRDMMTGDAAEVIVVGGGPAGAGCAAELVRAGMDVLVLDRDVFPRAKLCAGWVTPKTMRTIEQITEQSVPGLTELDRLVFHLYGLRIPLPVKQYAVRRTEFDHWLLRESGARFRQHTVRKIEMVNEQYVLDGMYQCKWLVGAGGTRCPVYTHFFRDRRKRNRKNAIAAIEVEYSIDCRNTHCHLWFFDGGLPGYAWYLPKADGWLNIGIGGKLARLKREGRTIRRYWDRFVQKLLDEAWIERLPPEPGTTVYHLRTSGPVQRDRSFIAGDAAGLATLDMGEGISAAMESGIQVARSIISDGTGSPGGVSRFSLPGILFSRLSKAPYSRSPIDPDE